MTHGQKAAAKLVTLKPAGGDLETISIAGVELGYDWTTNGETVGRIRAAIALEIDRARKAARGTLKRDMWRKENGKAKRTVVLGPKDVLAGKGVGNG